MKIEAYGKSFDSELEVRRYEYLVAYEVNFMYQDAYKKIPLNINLGKRKTYVPDFVEEYTDKVVITETKGYSKWSGNIDNEICDFMKNKVETDRGFLAEWLSKIGVDTRGKDIMYQRIKYNATYGWVDYDWKNPNTLANKRKNKITELEAEIKELKAYKKECERYFDYAYKLYLAEGNIYDLSFKYPLTKKQQDFVREFLDKKWSERS